MHKPLSKSKIKSLNKELAKKVSNETEIVILLQDVEDAINIGSIFRTADAAGVNQIILTGSTQAPPDSKIGMLSRGMERSVPWEYFKNTEEAIEILKQKDFQIIAVELTEQSQLYSKFEYQSKVCLVLGNEASGVYKKVLKLCDAHVAIPMLGKGPSLNVNVATAIAVYEVLRFRNSA